MNRPLALTCLVLVSQAASAGPPAPFHIEGNWDGSSCNLPSGGACNINLSSSSPIDFSCEVPYNPTRPSWGSFTQSASAGRLHVSSSTSRANFGCANYYTAGRLYADDLVISGPPGVVSTRLFLNVDFDIPPNPMGSAGGQARFRAMPYNVSWTSPSYEVSVSGSMASQSFIVPVGEAFPMEVYLYTGCWADPFSFPNCSIDCALVLGAGGLRGSGPVFDLPPGYTANSATLNIVDNVWVAPPPPPCAGDADGDFMVSFSDITNALANWGASYAPATGPGDSNHDGVVDIADITSSLSNWGSACE